MVGGERRAGLLLDPADHVEVGDRRLDHQHVGALFEVEHGLADRLGGVGGVELVAAAVAELRGRLGGLAEGAVEGGGVLGAVGDDRHAGVALLVELVADRADPAVHHVARRDRVGAGLGVGDRRFRQQLDRQVVVDLAVADEAAVAVRGVLAEADVGDHGQVGVGLLQRPDRHLHDALVVVGAGAGLVLAGRDAEEEDRADSGGGDVGGLGDQLGDREALDAGHRLDLLADALAGDDEGGLDQVRRGQLGLADEAAQGLVAAQAAQAGGGERHCDGECREGWGSRSDSRPAEGIEVSASRRLEPPRGLAQDSYGDAEALRGRRLGGWKPGELVAVIGPNGAGKTTLLSILAGIVKADAGRVESPGGEVGWVPQQAGLYRRLTVEENLLLFARLEGHADPRASVEEMLELTGLAGAAGGDRGAALGRQPAADQHRDRAAGAAGGAAARRAERRARPAPAGAALGVRLGARRARHDGDLLHPRHPGGGALRAAAARPRRRRGALRRHRRSSCARRCAARRPRPPAATSRPPSSPSSSTGGTDALAAAQGPADPPPLAAAGGAAGRLPGADRAADRLRDLARARASRRSPSSTKCRPGRGSPPAARSCRRSASTGGSAAGSTASGSAAAARRSTRSAPAKCWRR